MKNYTIYDAKTNLSKIIKQVLAGEQVAIGPGGRPVVELKPLKKLPADKSFYGVWRGKVKFSADYDQADVEIAKAFKKHFDK